MSLLNHELRFPQASKIVAAKAIGVLILIYFAYVGREMWLPLGLAFLLALVLDPIVDRMELRGWNRTRASAFIFGSFLLITAGLLVLAYPHIMAQAGTLQRGFEKYFPDPSHAGLLRSFRGMGLPPALANGSVATVEGARNTIQHSSHWLGDYGIALATNAIWIVIIPVIAFYTLRDFHMILAKGLLLVPQARRDLVQTAVAEVTIVFGKYLRGLAIVSVLNGVATAALLTAIRVPGALILGVVAGLLYSVPYVGALLTLALTACVAFVGGGPNMLLLAVGLSTVLHQIIFDQIISPRVLGGHVGLHPILSIIALLFGNVLLGIIGMILAVPIAACIQLAVLAILPKLSLVIPIQLQIPEAKEEVATNLTETKKENPDKTASEVMRAAVSAAVEFVDEAASSSIPDALLAKPVSDANVDPLDSIAIVVPAQKDPEKS